MQRKPRYRAWLLGMLVLLPGLLASPAAAQDHFFDSDGVRLRYLVEGEGEPVVLLHGLVGNVYLQWKLPGIMTALAQDYQVIALDQRAHGRSGSPRDPAEYGVEMVEDVVRLLDHLKIERAHVVGYSMGGFIAAKLVTVHPDRLLTATLGGAGWSKADDVRADFMGELAESLDRGQGIRPLLVRLTPPGRRLPSEERLRFITRLMNWTHDTKSLAALVRGMDQLCIEEEQLRANHVPTLAIVGESDPLKITVDELVGVMSNLETVVLAGADHMDAFAQPEFVHSLKSFLARHALAAVEGDQAEMDKHRTAEVPAPSKSGSTQRPAGSVGR
ncbi:MAG: alpha/beta hydrolase [Pirellulales bacterium]